MSSAYQYGGWSYHSANLDVGIVQDEEGNEYKGFRYQSKTGLFIDSRKRLKKALDSINAGDNFIERPRDQSTDEEGRLIEVISFSPKETAIGSLSEREKEVFLREAAKTLSLMHEKFVVCSAIEKKNVYPFRAKDGKIHAAIRGCEFFFLQPQEQGHPFGTHGVSDLSYIAPESVKANRGRGSASTVKSDVFALGLLFYEYLSGKNATNLIQTGWHIVGTSNTGYVGEHLEKGGEIKIGKEIKEERVRKLIAGMLDPDQGRRLAMREIGPVLKGEKQPRYCRQIIVDRGQANDLSFTDIRKGSDKAPKGEAISDEERKRVFRRGEEPEQEKEGSVIEEEPAVEEAKPEPEEKGPVYCEPWEEHAVTFDYDAMKAAGIVGGIERYAKPSGAKVYKAYYQLGGNATEYKVDMLLMLGWAKKVTPAVRAETPAPAKEEAEERKIEAVVPEEEPIETTEPEKIDVPEEREAVLPEEKEDLSAEETRIETPEEPVGEKEEAAEEETPEPERIDVPVEDVPSEDVEEVDEEPIDETPVWDEDAGYAIAEDELALAGYLGMTKFEQEGRKGYLIVKDGENQRFFTGEDVKKLQFLKKENV